MKYTVDMTLAEKVASWSLFFMLPVNLIAAVVFFPALLITIPWAIWAVITASLA